MRSPSNVLCYLPKPGTPGFNLASPRIFQVLIALLQHAIRFGVPRASLTVDSCGSETVHAVAGPAECEESEPHSSIEPRATKREEIHGDRVTALQAVWTVGALARACGCNRNTAGAALQELVVLGWISKSRERHVGGEFGGFRYRLLEQTEDRVERIKESAALDAEQKVSQAVAIDG